jgi:hypothetical protein
LTYTLRGSTGQVPQLWSNSFIARGDHDVLNRRVSLIAENEAEKERDARRKVENRLALADAKAQGKEAVAAVRARIAQEQAAAAEAKKVQKLKAMAERQEKKARIAAENKKVCLLFLISILCLLLIFFTSRGQ